MKLLALLGTFWFCYSLTAQSPAVDIEGLGVLLPRLTNAERNAITNPQEGLVIYNLDNQCMEVYRGNGWYNMCDGGSFTTGNPNALFGGSGDDEALDIDRSDKGSYVVVGFSDSSADGEIPHVSNGFDDYLVVRFNAIGDTLWTKLLGGNGIENALGITEDDTGGHVIVGHSSSNQNGDVTDASNGSVDCWIVKVDSAGDTSWNHLVGGSGIDVATSITKTLDGGFLFTGTSTSSGSGDITDISNGLDDYLLVKLDASGNIEWHNLIGGPSRDVATAVVPTIDSGFVIAGTVVLFGGGDITGAVAGDSDAWVVKVDKNGNIVWNTLLGGNGQETAASLMLTNDGGYIIAGHSNSTSGNVSNVTNGLLDFFVAKINSSGFKVWDVLIGGDDDDEAASIFPTADGGYIVAGRSLSSMSDDVTDSNNGMYDFWVVKLDSNGNILWNNLIGGSADDEPSSIVQSYDGGYIITGRSRSNNSGDVTDAGNGQFDYWIVKLDSNGNVQN